MTIEQGWRLLEEAESATSIREAARTGAASAQLLTRAAERLASLGEANAAHDLLAAAVEIGGPPAPAQIAFARSLAQRGDPAAALRWFRGGLLRG